MTTESFKNILVPVDFSENTAISLMKASELSEPFNTVIHLFHQARNGFHFNRYNMYGFLTGPDDEYYKSKCDIEYKLELCREKLLDSTPLKAVLFHIADEGHLQQQIIESANRVQADMVIIVKRKNRFFYSHFNSVDTSDVARKTNSAVLSLKNGSIPEKIKSVVLPVRSFLPERKLKLLAAITKKNRPTIHLVTHYSEHNSKTSAFADTYRILSHYMHYPVEYKVLEGNNFPKAILEYAALAGANLVLANPFEETRINSFYGTDIGDKIHPALKLCVLTAAPFHH